MLLEKLNIDLISVDIRLYGRLTLHYKAFTQDQNAKQTRQDSGDTNTQSNFSVWGGGARQYQSTPMQSHTGCGAAKSSFRNDMKIIRQINQQFSVFLKP